MSNKKPMKIPKRKRVGIDADAMLRNPQFLSNSAAWPMLAEAIWASVYGRDPSATFNCPPPAYRSNGFSVLLNHESDSVAWDYQSRKARVYMESRFKFDCALYPKLWRYLVERLPVVAAQMKYE
jgi:hypothetical protein